MNSKYLRIRWVDQIVSDTKSVSNFYSELFGFEKEAIDEGEGFTSYCLNNEEGENIFGIVEEKIFRNWSHGWVLYFAVPDEEYDNHCKKAEELGAELIYKSPMQCLLKDPSGAPIVINPEKINEEVENS